MHAGEYRYFTKPIIENNISDLDWIYSGLDQSGLPSQTIVIAGYIIYKDRIGISRRTAFYRYYEATKHQFLTMPDPNPDYEHVD